MRLTWPAAPRRFRTLHSRPELPKASCSRSFLQYACPVSSVCPWAAAASGRNEAKRNGWRTRTRGVCRGRSWHLPREPPPRRVQHFTQLACGRGGAPGRPPTGTHRRARLGRAFSGPKCPKGPFVPVGGRPSHSTSATSQPIYIAQTLGWGVGVVLSVRWRSQPFSLRSASVTSGRGADIPAGGLGQISPAP